MERTAKIAVVNTPAKRRTNAHPRRIKLFARRSPRPRGLTLPKRLDEEVARLHLEKIPAGNSAA